MGGLTETNIWTVILVWTVILSWFFPVKTLLSLLQHFKTFEIRWNDKQHKCGCSWKTSYKIKWQTKFMIIYYYVERQCFFNQPYGYKYYKRNTWVNPFILTFDLVFILNLFLVFATWSIHNQYRNNDSYSL